MDEEGTLRLFILLTTDNFDFVKTQEIHFRDVMKMAFKVYDDGDGTSVETVSTLLKAIDGPTLSRQEIQMLVEEGNSSDDLN